MTGKPNFASCTKNGSATAILTMKNYFGLTSDNSRKRRSATIEAADTMVEKSAERKQGNGLRHKGQRGYHPLVVTLATTQKVLYRANLSCNRPSDEHSSFFFDLAIDQCRKVGFRKIVLRGNTKLSSTEQLDR
jgi:hypothetical protein